MQLRKQCYYKYWNYLFNTFRRFRCLFLFVSFFFSLRNMTISLVCQLDNFPRVSTDYKDWKKVTECKIHDNNFWAVILTAINLYIDTCNYILHQRIMYYSCCEGTKPVLLCAQDHKNNPLVSGRIKYRKICWCVT